METKEIIQKVTAAFDASDTEAILGYMADDVSWEMMGDQTISGKDDMRKFLAGMSDMKMVSSTKKHIIVDGDAAAVHGDVQYKGKDGQLMDMYYCDVYELENGKVEKMTSYIVDKKKG